MISRMLGAPLGGTMRGGHQVLEPWSVSLITPPNFGGGEGSWLPGRVIVALGSPSVPVTTCANAGLTPISVDARQTTAIENCRSRFMKSPGGLNTVKARTG